MYCSAGSYVWYTGLTQQLLSTEREERKSILQTFSCTFCGSVFLLSKEAFAECAARKSPHVKLATLEGMNRGWEQMKQVIYCIYIFLFLDCGCVHRPPPALPIPPLISVMSEKRSSGRGSWQRFDWPVALAHTSKVKVLLYFVNDWKCHFLKSQKP